MASCIYSFWHGVIPTSYFIFNDFYTCQIYKAGQWCATQSLPVLALLLSPGESGVVYRGYINLGDGNELVAVKTGKSNYVYLFATCTCALAAMCLQPVGLSTASDKEKLLKEVAIMLSLKHPNVMSLLAVCFDGEMPLLIMPFMSSGNLLAHVKQNRERLHCATETDNTQVK